MSKIVKTVALVAVVCATASAAQAGGWGAHHPRRAEVNARLENQHDRIQAGLHDGQLTRAEARGIAREDHSIRLEERNMARFDNGHITRADQRSLNQQENAVSEQIYDERR
ncbi:MAG TPA: hypothetical protein VKU90_09715 [Caulobacteraceae bacterium]|nr:hypothetical protein [Caulobacteraceae bacterium]